MSLVESMARTLAELHVQRKEKTHVVDSGLVRRPLDRYPYAGKVYGVDEVAALLCEAERCWLTEGPGARQFEAALEGIVGHKVITCNSGSSANLLAVSAAMDEKFGSCKWCRGHEIATTALGFPTTLAPLVQRGLRPVFIDVDLHTWNVDVDEFAQAADEHDFAGAMFAHTLGNPFDVGSVRSILGPNKILIEDACDALGSTIDGQPCGSFGHFATFSFYPPHHITTGEGGAVACSPEGAATVVRSLRDWGRDCTCEAGQNNRCGHRFDGQWGKLPEGYDHKFVYSRAGYNLKMTDLQARVGVVQLGRLAAFKDARRRNWNTMRVALVDVIDSGLIDYQHMHPYSVPSPFGFGIRLTGCKRRRRDVVADLAAQGIDTRHPFAGNLARQPAFLGVGGEAPLPNTDMLCERAFFVGVYPGLSADDVRHVAAAIVRAVTK